MQSQELSLTSMPNKSQANKYMEPADPPKFLSYDEQERIALTIDLLAEKGTLNETFCYYYGPFISYALNLPVSFLSWRAGFRGYGLSKYGRSRLMTVGLAFMYPIYGGLAVSVWGSQNLIKPFRKESPIHHGFTYVMAHSLGVFTVTTANIVIAFTVANRSGLLPIPEGMHRPGIRQIASQILFKRVKPYTRNIAISAALSTIIMFAVGAGSYYQSCQLLKKIGRSTLIENEKLRS